MQYFLSQLIVNTHNIFLAKDIYQEYAKNSNYITEHNINAAFLENFEIFLKFLFNNMQSNLHLIQILFQITNLLLF